MSDDSTTPAKDLPLIVTCGFGTAVGMWWTGYVTHLPLVRDAVPGPLIFTGIALWMLGGGYYCARRAAKPLRAALAAGFVAGIVNLMVFGSLLAEGDGADRGEAAARVGLFLLSSSVAGGIGALGARRRSAGVRGFDAAGGLGFVAVAATVLVLITGGLVTTYEVGMAVEDWPTSYGSNMFLYPLSKMVGGIYFEHAHRLFGSLVGVTVLTLALLILKSERQLRRLGELLFLFVAGLGVAYLFARDSDGDSTRGEIWLGGAILFTTVVWLLRWCRLRIRGEPALAVGALLVFLIICLQGMLGGMRVLEDNLELAALHGVTGQLAFLAVVALALTSARAWRAAATAEPVTSTGDRRALNLLLAGLLAQLVLGALLRHFGEGWLMLHIAGGVAVFLLAAHGSIRLIGLHGEVPVLRRGGRGLLLIVVAQFALGFAAFAVIGVDLQKEPETAAEVLVPTAHQATGALLFATALYATLWVHRLGPVSTPTEAVKTATS